MLTITKSRPVSFQAIKRSFLSTIEIFKTIPLHAIGEIENQMTEKKVVKHATIFQEDDSADSVWFVKRGFVKEIHLSAEGRSQTLCMVGANGMFGISAFNGGTYGFQGIAESDATVSSLSIRRLQELMDKYPHVGSAVIRHISKLLRRSKDMQTLSQESVEKRLLYALIQMAGEFGNAIPLTRREFAEMAGTAPETCIRFFLRFEKEGLIAARPGQITIKRLDALKERLEGAA